MSISADLSPDTIVGHAQYNGQVYSTVRLSSILSDIIESHYTKSESDERFLRLYQAIDADVGDFNFATGDGTVFIMADGTCVKKKIVGELSSDSLAELGEDLSSRLAAVLCDSNVSSIGPRAFINCENLKLVSMPEVTAISAGAFVRTSSLKSLYGPKVEAIGSNGFQQTGLERVSLPNLTSLGYAAFVLATRLKSVDMPKLETMEGAAADEEGNVFDAVTFAYCESLESISLPSLQTINGEAAFLNCVNLKCASFPKARDIGANVFLCQEEDEDGYATPTWQDSLVYVNAQNASEIKEYAFANCRELKAVDAFYATSVGKCAFAAALQLEHLALPNARTIGDSAFEHCYELKEVSLPAAVSLGERAFDSCLDLKAAQFPELSGVGKYAFVDCRRLERADLPKATVVNPFAFKSCFKLKHVDLENAESFPIEGGDGKEFPESQNQSAAFLYCYGLESVDLPKAEFVGSNLFAQCAGLKYIRIPSAKTVGHLVFEACQQLKTVDFGNSLSAIPQTGNHLFYNHQLSNHVDVVVPDALLESWSSDDKWKKQTNTAIRDFTASSTYCQRTDFTWQEIVDYVDAHNFKGV